MVGWFQREREALANPSLLEESFPSISILRRLVEEGAILEPLSNRHIHRYFYSKGHNRIMYTGGDRVSVSSSFWVRECSGSGAQSHRRFVLWALVSGEKADEPNPRLPHSTVS